MSPRSQRDPGVPRASVIAGGLLAGEAVWVSRTFDSVVWLAPAVFFTALLVWFRLRRTAQSEMAERTIRTAEATAAPKAFSPFVAMAAGSVVAGLLMMVERASHHAGTGMNFLLLAADVLAHLAWMSGAVMMVGWPRSGHPMMIPAGVVLTLVTIAAGGVSSSLNGQTTAALAFCIVLALFSQSVHVARVRHAIASRSTLPPAMHRLPLGSDEASFAGVGPANGSTSPAHVKTLLSLLVLSLVLIVTSALASATHEVLPEVQVQLHRRLRDSLEAVRIEPRLVGNQYVNGSRFGSIRLHLLSDPQGLALRVHADSSPGYLRGNAFDVFDQRRWLAIESLGAERLQELGVGSASRAASSLRDQRGSEREQFEHRLQEAESESVISVQRGVEARDEMDPLHRTVDPTSLATTRLHGGSARRMRRFEFPTPGGERVATIEVHNEPAKGPVTFTPLATAWVEAVARQLTVSAHEVVLSGIDLSEPYVVGVSDQTGAAALPEELRAALLVVPSSIAAVADDVLDELVDERMSPRAKATRISSHFQNKFSYSLEPTARSRSVDPVAHFLRTRHPAHCEYFATASAMLLRRAGVPTRYVTGYVVDEPSDEDASWLARNADAHSWVEAYDDATGTWFAVESTPGRTYSTIALPAEAALGDAGAANRGDEMRDEQVTFLEQLARWWAFVRSNDPLMAMLRLLQVPLLVVVAGLLWYRHRAIAGDASDALDAHSHRLLARVDRRLRRHGLVRRPDETLHQFADRVEAAAFERSDAPYRLAEWYREYANARYQNQAPTAFSSS